MCDKKSYGSKRAAHFAVTKMGNSIRCYYHPGCGWHVTKERTPRNKPGN